MDVAARDCQAADRGQPRRQRVCAHGARRRQPGRMAPTRPSSTHRSRTSTTPTPSNSPSSSRPTAARPSRRRRRARPPSATPNASCAEHGRRARAGLVQPRHRRRSDERQQRAARRQLLRRAQHRRRHDVDQRLVLAAGRRRSRCRTSTPIGTRSRSRTSAEPDGVRRLRRRAVLVDERVLGGVGPPPSPGTTPTTAASRTHLFYGISSGDPTGGDENVVFGGLQDNGTRFRDLDPTMGKPTTFNQVIGGDGIGTALARGPAGANAYWSSLP